MKKFRLWPKCLLTGNVMVKMYSIGGDLLEPVIGKSYRGETIKEIAKLILTNPCINLKDVANILNKSYNTISSAYNKLIKEPDSYAVRFGLNINSLTDALLARNSRKANLIRSKRNSRKGNIIDPKRKIMEANFLKLDADQERIAYERKKRARWLWIRRKNERGV